VADCQNEATRVGVGLCEKHYYRMRRGGTLEKRFPAKPFEHSEGYILIPANGHPLALPGDSHIYEHRKVYYDAHGAGPFDCYHCGAGVTWQTMDVDHLDDDRKNNAPGNLVASCPICNRLRGTAKMTATRKSQGVMVTFKGETLCTSDWARRLGISAVGMTFRLKNWPVERALTEKRGNKGPKKTP
jgi:uncharacterized Zn-finger protein